MYENVLSRIGEVLHENRTSDSDRPLLVVIDGRCGSGKTLLAARIQETFSGGALYHAVCGAGLPTGDRGACPDLEYPVYESSARTCNVFHMDDFYLPPDRRAADWERQIGGNMDFERLICEVLEPACRGEGGRYRIYDCGSGSCCRKSFGPAALTVVEGSYSLKALQMSEESGTMKIFLTCSPEVQKKRLMAREGDRFAAFEKRWIPMEERYCAECHPMGQADIVIDTTDDSVPTA